MPTSDYIVAAVIIAAIGIAALVMWALCRAADSDGALDDLNDEEGRNICTRK